MEVWPSGLRNYEFDGKLKNISLILSSIMKSLKLKDLKQNSGKLSI